MRTWVYGGKGPGPEPEDHSELARAQLRAAHTYYNALIEIERARLVALCGAGDDETQKNAVHEGYLAQRRAARAATEAYWGTYLLVEDAVGRAVKGLFRVRAKEAGVCGRCGEELPAGTEIELRKGPGGAVQSVGCAKCGSGLRFRRWDGSGVLGVQLQGGLDVAALFEGHDTRVRIHGEGKHRVLWLRAGSGGINGRAPIWIRFRIVYHRPLPPEASIKWIRAVARRVADKTKWEVQFVIEAPEAAFALAPPHKGSLAIDVGWRKVGDELRVATWVDDAGEKGELRLPARLLARDRKVCDLQSIRSKNTLAVLDDLMLARKQDGASWPKWLLDATEHCHAWKGPRRLVPLVLTWRKAHEEAVAMGHEGVVGLPPEATRLFQRLEEWRKQDKHLWTWEANQRESVGLNRREIYRIFAKQAATYRQIIVEQIDLAKLAKLDEKPEDRLAPAIRGARFDAGLYELFGALVDAAKRAGTEWTEIDPVDTSRRCAACGSLETLSPQAIEHTCSACKATWDQDVNAATNLLAKARAGQVAQKPTRAQKRVVDPNKPTLRERRTAGKARRAATKTDQQEVTP